MWVQLFIASVIRHERTRYSYGYKWTLERMAATEVRLPSDETGRPDFGYMEDYMRGLPFTSAIA
jgi:hypothetical protein